MAYVMLGRCETIEDMFIIGDFDPKQIRADQQAEMVTRSMNEVAREREFLDQAVSYTHLRAHET